MEKENQLLDLMDLLCELMAGQEPDDALAALLEAVQGTELGTEALCRMVVLEHARANLAEARYFNLQTLRDLGGLKEPAGDGS